MANNKYFVESPAMSTGKVFIDTYTGVAFGVRQINFERQATGTLTFPDNTSLELVNVNPGQKWTFKSLYSEFEIILVELNYLYDTFKVQVREK